MAGSLLDDRAKKQKLDESAPPPGPAHSRPAPPPPRPTHSLPSALREPSAPDPASVRAMLLERKDQYTAAMKQSRTRGDSARQREYARMAVQFGRVVKALDDKQPIDLAQMPGPPPGVLPGGATPGHVQPGRSLGSCDMPLKGVTRIPTFPLYPPCAGYRSRFNLDLSKYTPPPQATPPQATPPTTQQAAAVAAESAMPPQPEGDEIDPQIPTPRNTLEALEQRLAKYLQTQREAEEKGESSRVRRLGRIIKQYDLALKATKAKKPYDYSDLPAPPGYPPIPAGPVSVPRPTQSLPVAPPPSHAPSSALPLISPSVSQKQVRARQPAPANAAHPPPPPPPPLAVPAAAEEGGAAVGRQESQGRRRQGDGPALPQAAQGRGSHGGRG